MASTVNLPAAGSPDLKYRTCWQGMGWGMVATVVWLSLIPNPVEPPAFLSWDKAQHLVAYGWLMYWYGMCFQRHWRWPAFLIVMGIGLEFLQGLGGARTSDFFDMVANSLGVLFGFILANSPLGKTLAFFDHLLSRHSR